MTKYIAPKFEKVPFSKRLIESNKLFLDQQEEKERGDSSIKSILSGEFKVTLPKTMLTVSVATKTIGVAFICTFIGATDSFLRWLVPKELRHQKVGFLNAYILKPYRGKGIGKVLVERSLKDFAAEHKDVEYVLIGDKLRRYEPQRLTRLEPIYARLGSSVSLQHKVKIRYCVEVAA